MPEVKFIAVVKKTFRYARIVIKHGWSRSVLVHQIESDLYSRQGKAITNFPETLPAPQSDLANQLLKDPYHLDFLSIGPDVTERQLEMALLERLKNFLLELGKVNGRPKLSRRVESFWLPLSQQKPNKTKKNLSVLPPGRRHYPPTGRRP